MRLALLLLLLATPAWACPTCSTATMPGLGSATDLSGAYPDRLARPAAPRFALEGADQRARVLSGVGEKRLRIEAFATRRTPLEAPKILAGFSVKAGGIGLHICGPELTFEVEY